MKSLLSLLFLYISTVAIAQSNWMTLQTDLTGEYDLPKSVNASVNSNHTMTALYFEIPMKKMGEVMLLDNVKKEIIKKILFKLEFCFHRKIVLIFFY